MDNSVICGLIAGAVTLIVCLINNAYSLKKERNAHDEKTREQLKLIEKTANDNTSQMKADMQKQMEALEKSHQSQIDAITKQISDIMMDVSARIEEIIANQEASHIAIKKDIDHLNFYLRELDSKVEKHNQVIERTYILEKITEVQEEKLKVCNHRIDDLERNTKDAAK